ncbi:hypothetical protein H6F88_26785 [Oculatella sp. FACHB-28]|uniref:hypothetical protein n=1 Tax=Oculatella sp. FACHB-28 TaxID=2692845 RepID=UPI00168606B5|nr:hypothetical protein [Oculatella sp. FACHB-28]MBD2059559.1 hypothetical protein [Oculatella sp. FACHB-28]
MVLVSSSKCFDYSDMCLKVRHDAPYKMAIAKITLAAVQAIAKTALDHDNEKTKASLN